MDRKIYQKLLVWKEKNSKMPYMLVGARQTGKTYILTNFCKNELLIRQIHSFLFRKESSYEQDYKKRS